MKLTPAEVTTAGDLLSLVLDAAHRGVYVGCMSEPWRAPFAIDVAYPGDLTDIDPDAAVRAARCRPDCLYACTFRR